MDTSQIANKATRIDLFNLKTVQMRAFHMSWFAFFMAFFGWFGVAPLMVIIRDDLQLSRAEVGNTIIASVAATVVARLVVGRLTDRFGPRRTYAWLLIVGAIPVMGIGLAQNYETFLLFRLGIGVIGASFVITQYHTSVMFGSNVVGVANATTAGWGNVGGGVAQIAIPLLLASLIGLGVDAAVGWRVTMIVPGVALLVTGVMYYRATQDAPDGDFRDLRTAPGSGQGAEKTGSFWLAARDHRVWALFLIYGACFGIELTMHNVAALYFYDRFSMGLGVAGLIAGLFGLMNIFARTLGGRFGDIAGKRFGLRGRVLFLGAVLFVEGLALIFFSRMGALVLAVPAMLVVGLFVQMSSGATFSVVPFLNPKALVSVAGIVGAGGNAGAVAAGFLFRMESLPAQDAFLYLGVIVVLASGLSFVVRFTPESEQRRQLADPLTVDVQPRLTARIQSSPSSE